MFLVPDQVYYEVKYRFENEPELLNPPEESWSCNIS